MLCPLCDSENLEADDPSPGEYTCRDCGEVWAKDEIDLTMKVFADLRRDG